MKRWLALLGLLIGFSLAQPITLQFWTISLKPRFDAYIDGLIQAYEKAHPGITIQWSDFPIGTIQDKLLAAIAAGQSPDVVNLNGEFALPLAAKGGLVNLGKVLGAASLKAYFPGLLASGTLGGKVYALPWYVSADVLIYNKAIFQEAGISSPPRTWSQVFQDARIIEEKTSKSGIAPLPLPGDWLQENGVQVISVRRQIATFDTPAGVRALQVYVNLVKQGIVGQDAVNYDYLRALNEYESGQLAMLATGPQFLVRIKDEAPKIYQVTGVTEYPLAKARWIPTPLMDLVVPKASAHPRQAAQFARFVTDGANQLAFSEIVAILPSVIRAAQNPFFHSHLNTLEGQALAISVDELKYGHDRVFGGCRGNDGNITSILEDAFTAAMLGNTTPAAALHHAAKKVDALLASCR